MTAFPAKCLAGLLLAFDGHIHLGEEDAMRLILIALAMLCCSVTAHAAATFNFITDRYWVDCCENIDPLPLSVSILVNEQAFNSGKVSAADVITFSAFGTEPINFNVAGVPGWVFNGDMATYFMDGNFIRQYFFSATYDEGWDVFVRFASQTSSFVISNTMGSHESDGPNCPITGSCQVEGHWEAAAPIPEPASIFLTLTALGLWLIAMSLAKGR